MSATMQEVQTAAGADWMTYGPDTGREPVPIAASFDAYEAEYAAIRKYVGILHLPQRGLLELRGTDVRDLLHRLMTQDIAAMTGGQTRRAFQLNEKGRIVSDLYVHFGDAATWVEADVFDLPAVRELLESRIFTEDVTIQDISDQRTCIALHGPASADLLQGLTADRVNRVVDMPQTTHVLTVDGLRLSMTRRDGCGGLGLMLFVPRNGAAALYERMLEAAGFDPNAPDPERDPEGAARAADKRRRSLRGRPIGWLAFNTARIEAGAPIFHIDFGPDSLPAETGSDLLDETVSFTKGCYLGQEIVARMHNLGHPKRVLVGLRFEGDLLPAAGTPVQEPATEGQGPNQGAVIGAVTSSTMSPLLGQRPIALATMKWGKHRHGTPICALAEQDMAGGTVCPIRFLNSS